MDSHTRWGMAPFLSGAYAPSGGHVRALGFTYAWIKQWNMADRYLPMWQFDFFRLFHVRHEPGRTRWAVASVSLKFTRAGWRIGKREEARERRRSRRHIVAAMSRATSPVSPAVEG